MATTTTQVPNWTNSGTWTSLGAGPLALEAIEGDVFIQIGTAAPSGPGGLVLHKTDGRQDFDTTGTLWGLSADISGPATIVSAPVTA